jgi:hypothetical protein
MSDDLYDGPCEAGCISFHGGERKHHKDCGHYPHSLTKVNADRIEELEAKLEVVTASRDMMKRLLASAEDDLNKAASITERLRDAWLVRDLVSSDFDRALAELKGEDRG